MPAPAIRLSGFPPYRDAKYGSSPVGMLGAACNPLGGRVKNSMAISYYEPITFGRSGIAKTLNCSGIDFSEDGFESWTSAPVAEMDIALAIARQEVLFQMDVAPFIIPDSIAAQSVFIFLGGFFIGYCMLAEPAVREFPIARNLISGRPMRLSLVIPTAKSPHSLRISDDLRQLGLHLHSMVFRA